MRTNLDLKDLIARWRGRHASLEVTLARPGDEKPPERFHYEGILDGPYGDQGPGVGFMLGSKLISGDIAIRGPFIDFAPERLDRPSSLILTPGVRGDSRSAATRHRESGRRGGHLGGDAHRWAGCWMPPQSLHGVAIGQPARNRIAAVATRRGLDRDPYRSGRARRIPPPVELDRGQHLHVRRCCTPCAVTGGGRDDRLGGGRAATYADQHGGTPGPCRKAAVAQGWSPPPLSSPEDRGVTARRTVTSPCANAEASIFAWCSWLRRSA